MSFERDLARLLGESLNLYFGRDAGYRRRWWASPVQDSMLVTLQENGKIYTMFVPLWVVPRTQDRMDGFLEGQLIPQFEAKKKGKENYWDD